MPLRKRRKEIFVTGAIVALIFLHHLNLLKFPEQMARRVYASISRIAHDWKINLAERYDLFNKRKTMAQLYQQCLDANKSLEINNVELKNLKAENDQLKKLANFKINSNFTLVSSKVIGKSSDSLEKIVFIDIGAKEAITTGLAVVAENGILVGKVIKVEKELSMVRLISDNQSRVAATILNKDKSLGVVEGGYGLSVRMTFIPRNETIMIGDKVMTSGLEKDMPRGLLIGEIIVAENESHQPFQQAVLSPAVDLNKLTVVGVLKKAKSDF